MADADIATLIRQLAARYRLTYSKTDERYVGIYRGVQIEVHGGNGVVSFVFSSPTARLASEFVTGFSGFQHCKEAGLPLTWLGSVGKDSPSHRAVDTAAERGRGLFCTLWALILGLLVGVMFVPKDPDSTPPDEDRCRLHAYDHRIEKIGSELFLEIPDLVARDFHGHGAERYPGR